MRVLALPRDDWPLIGAGAVLVVIAYPPFHLLIPSFLCLIPAVWLIVEGAADARPLRRHLVQGFWFGLLSHGLVLYWIVVALWRFTPAVVAGYFATILILAMYAAITFALAGWLMRSKGLSLLVGFPIFWTAAEWLIGHQGDIRFPWLGLGTSLTGYPTLVQVADLVGARGVGFLLVLANTALALAWMRRRERRSLLLAVSVAVGVMVAIGYGLIRERTLTPRRVGEVALLQPNVGFRDKWESSGMDSIVSSAVRLSRRAIAEAAPDLVIWPEAAVPHPLQWHPPWQVMIGEVGRESSTAQLVGGIHLIYRDDQSFDYFNSAFLFDSLGRHDAQPVYDKQYLVPITERVPFVNPRWFNLAFFGAFGVGGRGPVFEVGVGTFGVLICYESIFENLSRDYRRRGAAFLVNITNDAWFGRTSAPYQHAAHLVMRAIENRVGIARAANSGISEYVDPFGRQHRRTALYVEAVVSDELVTTDVVPLYTRWGDWVGRLSVVLAALLVGYGRWSRRQA